MQSPLANQRQKFELSHLLLEEAPEEGLPDTLRYRDKLLRPPSAI